MRQILPLLLCVSGLFLGCDAEVSPVAPVPDQGPDQAVMDAMTVDATAVDAAIVDAAPERDMSLPDVPLLDAVPPTDASTDMPAADMQVYEQGVEPDMIAADMTVASDMAPADAALADMGTPDAMIDLGPHGIDTYDPTCNDVNWMPGECIAGVGRLEESRGAQHIAVDVPIEYDLSPPAADNHRGQWANWGEYRSLPPQRWLHNLEHGGIALLYHPCAPAAVVDELRELAQARGPDFRWILTPYADLQSAVALVAWEWRYFAECVRPDEINQFFDLRHAMGPENVAGNGGYDSEWIGR